MAPCFARNAPSRLTFHPAHDLFPRWSPDGKRIAFTSLREGRPQLYELSVDSPGSEKVLLRSDLPNSPSDWSGDGHLLIYGVTDPKNSGDIWALPLVGKPEPFAVVATAADERYGTLSPNGRWLAYISNETGRYEVYVRAFPTSEVRHQVSMSGGFEPCWRRDGQELFYLGPDQTMMSAEVETNAATFRLGPPKPLFATRTKSIEIQQGARHYAVTADGQRFLIAAANGEAQITGITVVLNWTAALRK